MASSKKSTEEEKKKKRIKEEPKNTKTQTKKTTTTTSTSKPKKPKTNSSESVKNGGGGLEEVVIIPSSSSDSQDIQQQQQEEEEKISEITNQPSAKPAKPNKSKRKAKEEKNEEEAKICVFPMNKIKRMIESQGSDSSLDVVFLVNKASEMFIEQFCEDAYECSVQDRKKSLHYKYLSSVVSKQRRYDFLSDFVPEKLKAEDALAEWKSAETARRGQDRTLASH